MFARRLFIASLVCAMLTVALLPGIAGAVAPTFAPVDTLASAPLASVAVADFTGDTRMDVAASTTTGKILVFAGTAAGTLAAPVEHATRATGASDDLQLASGDLNGDGKTDLVMTNLLGVDVFLQGTGALTPGTNIILPNAVGVDVANVDADTKPDLVVGTPAGPVKLAGIGDGTFNLPSAIGPGAQSGLEVGDVVGDSRPDVVGFSGSNVNVYRQLDNGTFETRPPTTLPAAVSSIAIGDFTGDAGNDLAAATGTTTGGVHVFPHVAVESLGTPANYPSAASPQGLSAGDVDGDADTDLVTAHAGLAKAGVYTQEGDALSAESLYDVPSSANYRPRSTGVGNVVGDSLADVVVAGSGGLSILEGIAPVSPSPSPTVSPSPTETPLPGELSQEVPYSVWSQPSSSPPEGMGSWMAVHKDSAAGDGQLDPQYAHSAIFWFESRQALSLVSLVRNGDDKVATFAIIDGTGDPDVIGIPFEWVEGGFYLPLVHRLADGRWGAWVFDWADRDQGDEAWTFIGELGSPGQNKLSPVSSTLSFWYGPQATDCSDYPRAEVMRYPPLGLVGGQGSHATLAGHDAAEGDCDAQFSTELDVWEYYRLGEIAAG